MKLPATKSWLLGFALFTLVFSVSVCAQRSPAGSGTRALPHLGRTPIVHPMDSSNYFNLSLPSSVVFSAQAVNSSSQPVAIMLGEYDPGQVSVSSILATGDFTETNTCTSPMGPGQCYIFITFTPTALGTRSGTLTVMTNVSSSPLNVTLTGAGVPQGAGATAAAISSTGTQGDYTLTGTVTAARGSGLPTGNVSFVDRTNNDVSLGTAPLGASTIALSVASGPSLMHIHPMSIAVGDFNGDQKLDLAVANGDVGLPTPTTGVVIYLANGDGTFTFAPVQPSIPGGNNIVSGDFNGDGKLDLAVSGNDGGAAYPGFTVLWGNGDGTFTPQNVPLPSNTEYEYVVTGDFNGDGIADLGVLTAQEVSGTLNRNYTVTAFLGNINRSLSSVTGMLIVGFESAVVGDFTGDGKADIAILGWADRTEVVNVLPGNGNGSFGSPIPTNLDSSFWSNGDSMQQFAAGDFNADGKADLAIEGWIEKGGRPASDGVLVLTGNGDGTFSAGSPIGAGMTISNSGSVAVTDFNGDGKSDIAVLTDDAVQVLLSNGDGSFTALASVDSGAESGPNWLALAAGDFTGDGLPDLVAGDTDSQTIQTIFSQRTETASATLANVQVPGAGSHNVAAVYEGDSMFAGSTSSTTSLSANVAQTAMILVPDNAAPLYGSQITLTATLSPYSFDVLSTDGETVSFSSNGSVVGTGTLSGGVATLSTKSLAMGTNSVTASYAGDAYFGPAVSAPVSIHVTSAPSNAAPTLSTISPAFASAGSTGVEVTVTGSGFISGSTAYWGSTALATRYISDTQLTASVPTSCLASTGTVAVVVQTPAPGGGTSNSFRFEVDSANSAKDAPTFSTTTAAVVAGAKAMYSVALPAEATNPSVLCLNLPAGATCSYSAASGRLTVATSPTTPSGTYQITAVFTETLPGTASALIMLPILLLPFAAARRRWVRRLMLLAVCAGTTIGIAAVIGCGGNSGGTAPSNPSHQSTSSGTIYLTVK